MVKTASYPALIGNNQPADYYKDVFPLYFSSIDVPLEKDKYKITVKKISGWETTCEVTPQTLIEDLKFQIHLKDKSLPIWQNLIFASKLLEDERTVGEYNIQKDSKVQYIEIDKSGNLDYFEVPQEEKELDFGFSNATPKHRRCAIGLNIEGICSNSFCSAYNEQVICPIGLGTHDLIVNEDRMHCPICNEPIKPKICGFAKCSYSFTGMRKTSQSSPSQKYLVQEWTSTGDAYKNYAPDLSGEFIWSTLKIHTKADTTNQVFCGICKKNIADLPNSELMITKNCQHKFHQACYKSLSDEVKQLHECPLEQL